jgi:DNA invertase Pin-like site-specific DNA recombinase
MESVETLSKRLTAHTRQRVWAYVRVSSETQEDNQSLGMQAEAITKYCAEKGLEAPMFVEEVASAAKPLWVVTLPGAPPEERATQSSPRPRFMLLLNHLRMVKETLGSTSPVYLVVWRLDRLARVDYEQEFFISMFKRDGVKLHSVMPTEDHMLDGGHVKDPARAFTRLVLAGAAAYERAMIELRMGAGMAYKASQGGFTGGHPPFGYEAKNGELVINPYEAAMVRFIFHLRRRYGMSMGGISEHILAHKSKDDHNFYHRPKIGRILRTEQLYRGVYRDRFGATHVRPDLKILPDDEEKILDYDSQPQRTESLGLPGTSSLGPDHPAGSAGGDGGPRSLLGGEESPEGGLPADPQGDVQEGGDQAPGDGGASG